MVVLFLVHRLDQSSNALIANFIYFYWGDTRHWLALLRPRPAECYQGAWLVLVKKDTRAIAGFKFLIRTWGVKVVVEEADAHSRAWGYEYASLTEEIEEYAAKNA